MQGVDRVIGSYTVLLSYVEDVVESAGAVARRETAPYSPEVAKLLQSVRHMNGKAGEVHRELDSFFESLVEDQHV